MTNRKNSNIKVYFASLSDLRKAEDVIMTLQDDVPRTILSHINTQDNISDCYLEVIYNNLSTYSDQGMKDLALLKRIGGKEVCQCDFYRAF